jgi:protoporphyrinogen oxidase
MNDTHIIVIGGGFAGVAAARKLRARGATVTLLDARASLGGRAHSDVLDGVSVDAGAQLITSSFTRTVGMLATPLHRVAVGDAVLRDGARLPLRFGSVRSLLAFSGLTALEKVRLATHLLPALARYRHALDASGAHLPSALDGESARDYVERHIGANAADTLVEPPCNGFYGLCADHVSLAFFLTLGRYGSDGDVLAPAFGWSTALDAVLMDTEVVRGARVVSLDYAAHDRRRSVTAHCAGGRTWHGDAAIIATGPRAAAALLSAHRAPDDALITWLTTVPMRSTFTLALVVDAATPRDAVAIYRDVREARNVSACVMHNAKFADVARPRDVVLGWPTPAAVDALRDASAEHIATAMLPEMETLVPALRGHVTRARVYRYDEGSPIAFPGFARDRARARMLADSLDLPVGLAGDYLTTPLIEGAVASGERAAAQLADRLSRR